MVVLLQVDIVLLLLWMVIAGWVCRLIGFVVIAAVGVVVAIGCWPVKWFSAGGCVVVVFLVVLVWLSLSVWLSLLIVDWLAIFSRSLYCCVY